MRRLLKRRGLWLLFGVAALLVAVVAVLASRAGQFAAAKIEERLQLPTSIGSVVPGMSSTILYNVSIGDQSVNAHIDRLQVDASVLGLGLNGANAIRSVSIEGAQANVDLSSETFSSLMKRIGSRGASNSKPSDESERPRTSRTIVANDLELHVRDALGPLVSMTDANAEIDRKTGQTRCRVIDGR